MAVAATYKLKHPINVTMRTSDGERVDTISEIEIQQPLAKHMLTFDQLADRPIALQFAMLEQLTDLTRQTIEQLRPEDFSPLGELVGSLFGPSGPLIGETA